MNPNPKTDHLRATQFQPGVSGNPGGRRRKPYSEAHAKVADMPVAALFAGPKPGETVAEYLARVAARIAVTKHDVRMLTEITNRVEGKPLKYRQYPQD